MNTESLPSLTYVDDPTAVVEWRGLRLLTDPTFDLAGVSYELTAQTLRKTCGVRKPDSHRNRCDAGGPTGYGRAPPRGI